VTINAILKTTENLGDHAREISIAIDCKEDNTIKDIVSCYLINKYSGEYEHADHIEIRVCK